MLDVLIQILILQAEQKKKNTTVNPRNQDDKCFQYAITDALNYEEIESHQGRISNIEPFINKYNQK